MAPPHPLQRFASPARTVSLVIHAVGIYSFLQSFNFVHTYPQIAADSFGGHYQFLTILGLALSLVSFVFGAVADLTLIPQFFAAKNLVAVCAAPLEVLISVLYWGIRTIDKKLLVPEDVFLPFSADFGMHAAPALLLTLDLLLLSPPWTIQLQGVVSLSLVLAFAYWGWVEYCFSYNGLYVFL